MMPARQLFIRVCFALFAGTVPCAGQVDDEPTPVLTVHPRVDVLRSHAASPVEVHLSWNQPTLLEGDLRLHLYLDRKHLATITLPDFALLDNQVSRPVLIPAVSLPDQRSQCLLHGEFVTARQTYDLSTHDIPVSLDRKRVYVVGVVHPDRLEHPPEEFRDSVQGNFDLVYSLRLDGDPELEEVARDLVTRTIDIDPAELPDRALELVGFDLLLVTEDGFAELDDRQTGAVVEWVEAGGRVCVVTSKADTENQQRCLRRLAGESPIDPLLDFEPTGALRYLRERNRGWIYAFPGVGRAVVASAPIDVRGAAWRSQALQLLGIRASQRERLIQGEGWRVELPEAAREWGYLDPDYPVMGATALASEVELPQTLMPKSIQGVPFAAVCGVLVLCLIIGVPGDFLVLGWLKKRRWTWVTFPVIAFGFTLYTVSLAQSHVGSADYSTSLTFLDVAGDGRVVKTIRYELLFTATEKSIETAHANSLIVPFSPAAASGARSTALSGIDGESAGPYQYDGRVPVQFNLSRRHRQWAPRVSCETAFAGDRAQLGPFADFDWDGVETETEAGRERLVTDVIGRDPSAVVILVQRGEASLLSRERPAEPAWNIAIGASSRGSDGVFGVVSDRAPGLAGTFEDLAVVDATDAGDRLLLIILDDGGGNTTVLRRVMRDPP